ncbi:Conserved membrane protein in copper uptake, YcnI [Candidatus Rhodobacter oscarellae]|uniref:Conserved membrane protein in copper uptake, YcnI n=1 Tax=Candidatus Rhodobacter oscarellae TaxID=1675527 RepID=A0A0J9EA15_9RHOB|nr:YcnI family protein [Candidatus Rhodobacter lobularis]KMW58519.1 Conserved membrane protein in copper uptake, YcnI [Candidatus Rhodobacter lobularis]
MKTTFTAAVAATLALSASQAAAHASLEVKEAALNANYKAVMRVSHGCAGQATESVTITIPEGVINAKPKPKPGWELTTVVEPYARTYEYHGQRSEGVTSITWTGRLEDAHYDEFIFRARITDAFEPGQMLYFPTVQTCADGSLEWVVIPVAGEERPRRPAPGLKLLEGGHAHH